MNLIKIIFYFFLLFFSSTNIYATNFNLIEIVNLNTPWGMTFIDKDQLMISEKNGKIKLLKISTNEMIEIKHNLNISSIGQGGLLDILYKDSKIWVSYVEIRKNYKTSTSIAIGTLNNKAIIFKNIFQAEPPIKSSYHFGSRIVIKDNYLFASIGERGLGMIAQDPTKHPGSIIRIHLDGSIPIDNPKFIKNTGWAEEIYQIGVRNPQGLTLSPFDSTIYLSNHGAKGGDWFGIVDIGTNYGWPLLGWGGTNYSGSIIGPKWQKGFIKAIYYWVPSIATSSIVIYKGKEFKEWNGHALITSLKDQSLRKLDFKDRENIKENTIFTDKIGRIRDIIVNPTDGKIFLLTTNKLWLMEKK